MGDELFYEKETWGKKNSLGIPPKSDQRILQSALHDCRERSAGLILPRRESNTGREAYPTIYLE